jgi:S-DNA-T family DNA segregation ATPase FtsK/SpoIIIE
VPTVPPELPALAAVFLAVLTLLSLMSHRPGEEVAVAGAAELRNHLGYLGAHFSAFLVKLFGLCSFWPVPALLLCPFYRLTSRGKEVPAFSAAAGIVLSLFSLLSLASVLFPGSMPVMWPGEASGGGAAGNFLAKGITPLAGRVGSCLTLPILAVAGLMLSTGVSLGSLGRLLGVLRPPAEREQDGERPSRPVLRGRDGASRAGGAASRAEEGRGAVKPAGESRGAGAADGDSGGEGFREGLGAAPDGLGDGFRGGGDGGGDGDGADLAGGGEGADRNGGSPSGAGGRERVPELKIREKPSRPARKPAAYKLPPADLLDPPPEEPGGWASMSREDLMANAAMLEAKLMEFGVDGRVMEVAGGPVITMYEYQPAPGVKISKVSGLASDLSMAMKAESIRVVAPIPGKNAIGIELPNPDRGLVTLRELIESREFAELESPLSLVLGVDITGCPAVTDLGRMPHLLIAGATGSGKSVGLDCMIMSILYKAGPDRVRFLMIDPKCVELAMYRDLPHLIHPVLTDPAEATTALKWAVCEMDARYRLMAEKGVRNIQGFNELAAKEKAAGAGDRGGEPTEPMPYLVIIIDELSDLMLTSPKDVEVAIMRLCAKARASGIHLILATQRPSVDVLTGVIKANLPTRISFQVATKFDSRTILDQVGAENLLGKGDMLFQPPGTSRLRRLHGAYVSDEEKRRVTDRIREYGPPEYIENLVPPEAEDGAGSGELDPLFHEAVEFVRAKGRATISLIQRQFRIGYNRAARIIEEMEREGVIGPQDGTRPRAIF